MLISRMGMSFSDLEISVARSRHMLLAAIHTMLDCPEENQTSPTRTPFRVMVVPWLFLTMKLRSSTEALSGESLSDQAPFLSATVDLVWPANSMVILLPGVSNPQTGTSDWRCRIMLFVKGVARLSVGSAAERVVISAERMMVKVALNIIVGRKSYLMSQAIFHIVECKLFGGFQFGNTLLNEVKTFPCAD